MMKTNINGKKRKELNLKELEAVNGAGVWEWIGINIIYPLGRGLQKSVAVVPSPTGLRFYKFTDFEYSERNGLC